MSELVLRVSLAQAGMINAALSITQQHIGMLVAELQGQIMSQIQSAPPGSTNEEKRED